MLSLFILLLLLNVRVRLVSIKALKFHNRDIRSIGTGHPWFLQHYSLNLSERNSLHQNAEVLWISSWKSVCINKSSVALINVRKGISWAEECKLLLFVIFFFLSAVVSPTDFIKFCVRVSVRFSLSLCYCSVCVMKILCFYPGEMYTTRSALPWF